MAIVVKRHRFPAQQIVDGTSQRFNERVFVSGLTITPGSEGEVIADARDAIISAVGSTYLGYVLGGITIESTGMDSAAGTIRWEIDGFGGTPTTTVITESTILTSRQTNLIPGTRIPMEVPSFNGIPADTAIMSIMFPHRVVNVAVLAAGELPEDQGEQVGKVNDTEWRGLPKGYWLISEHTITVSKYSGYYQRRLSAMSRVIEDWSETALFRNRDGKYATISDADRVAAIAPDYSYGVIYNTANKGIARFGPYATTDFDDFFGV